jgi:hypothetical protein
VALAVAIAAATVVYRRRTSIPLKLRDRDVDFMVLLVANIALALAVVLTQRPRPSYLLGFGFILVVAFCRLVQAAWPRAVAGSDKLLPVAAIAAVIAIPTYGSLGLPSATGRLNELYALFKEHSSLACRDGHEIAIGEYASELRNYVCRSPNTAVFPLSSFPAVESMNSEALVTELQRRRVHAVLVDRIFLRHKTKVRDCAELDAAFAADGWYRMAFSGDGAGFCDAAYLNMRPSPK